MFYYNHLFLLSLKTYGGGIQSIIGVTGAHNASADANTTMDTNPLLAARSRSKILVLSFTNVLECMYAPWGQCGLQVLLTVCLSLCIMSAFLLLFTKNKMVLPWLNKTVRQVTTYLQNSRLANLPSRTRASSSINGTRPRNLSNRFNPRTIFPKMNSAVRRRLKSSSPNGLSYKVILNSTNFI